MATVRVVFEMSDTVRDELVTSICIVRGYQSTINGEPNPITPAQFAMNDIIKYGQSIIAQQRHTNARNAATVATESALDTEIRAEGVVVASAEEV